MESSKFECRGFLLFLKLFYLSSGVSFSFSLLRSEYIFACSQAILYFKCLNRFIMNENVYTDRRRSMGVIATQHIYL